MVLSRDRVLNVLRVLILPHEGLVRGEGTTKVFTFLIGPRFGFNILTRRFERYCVLFIRLLGTGINERGSRKGVGIIARATTAAMRL